MKEINTVKDLITNEELMSYVTEDIEDFDDNAVVTYSVWAIGYNQDSCVTDTDMFIGEYTDPDEAIEKAKALTLADIIHQASEEDDGTRPEETITYISIEVETVVEDGEEGTMNVGTIYKRELWIDGEYGTDDNAPAVTEEYEDVVIMHDDEYELLEDSTLKVKCEILKNFNKNDTVQIMFADENGSPILTYKIISKAIYGDGDYYHCDFMY